MFNLQLINGFTPKNKFIYHSFQKDDVLLIAVDFLKVHSENKINNVCIRKCAGSTYEY